VKNFITLTLLSVGTPMICMGDEVRRTQSGNNNAYCQDNELSWFDWKLLEKHGDIHRFVKALLVGFRQKRDVVQEEPGLTLNALLRRARVDWHGTALGRPDWSESSRCLAFTLRTLFGKLDFHALLNAFWEPLSFELPPADAEGKEPWHRWIDTSVASPGDICDWDTAPVVADSTYRVEARSVVVLARRVRGR
jgi:glycogen operon protein